MDLKGYIYALAVTPHPAYPGSVIVTLPFDDKRVFACGANGESGSSPAGSQGQENTGQQTGSVIVFQNPANMFHPFGLLMVDKLWP